MSDLTERELAGITSSVVRDLHATIDSKVTVAIDQSAIGRGPQQSWSLRISVPAGPTTVMRVAAAEAAATVLVRVADAVQEMVLEFELVTWPECPNHTHPMEPRAKDGRALWVCPRGGPVETEIGKLIRTKG